MAHVDNLIERIPDPHLRAQIAEEVAKLVAHKDFGLVFQRHLPEDLEIPGTRPRRGDIVRLRTDAEKQNHVVLATKDGRATIIAVDATKQTIDGMEPATHAYDELVVVKDFSVPIYPGLAPLGEITRGGDKPTHIVIQGENYCALETLLYTHESQVDVVYIDPPYNTGTRDWIYNDRFVSPTDAYRHSKWLSFMERRLLHARRLLKPTGVIFVSIGHDERHRLRLLLDQVFGEHNFVSEISRRSGAGGRQNTYVKQTLDYVLVYRASDQTPGFLTPRDPAQLKQFKHEDDRGRYRTEPLYKATLESTGRWSRYWIECPDGTLAIPPGESFPPATAPLSPVQSVSESDKIWRWSADRFIENRDQDLVIFKKTKTSPLITPSGARSAWNIYTKQHLVEDEAGVAPLDYWSDVPNTLATKHLLRLGIQFPYAKPVELVARLVGMTGKRDAVVLDYFGGSGTTTEAVIRLNAQDNGERQSILVTNNELSAAVAAQLRKDGVSPGDTAWEREGVFAKVTRPRLEAVLEGVEENVAFFELTYEDENLVALGRRFDAVAPLLWMKAGGVGPVVRRRGDALWALPTGAAYGVLFSPAQAKAFAELIAVHDRELRHLFVVTDSESEFQEAVAYLPPELRLETTRLYSDYLHSFEINGKG